MRRNPHTCVLDRVYNFMVQFLCTPFRRSSSPTTLHSLAHTRSPLLPTIATRIRIPEMTEESHTQPNGVVPNGGLETNANRSSSNNSRESERRRRRRKQKKNNARLPADSDAAEDDGGAAADDESSKENNDPQKVLLHTLCSTRLFRRFFDVCSLFIRSRFLDSLLHLGVSL